MKLALPSTDLLRKLLPGWACVSVLGFALAATAVSAQTSGKVEVHGHLAIEGDPRVKNVPAVLWLDALDGQPPPFPAHGRYTLLQKNREFSPHLLVIPVGSDVTFPNGDTFFHNVFSLFDGKRFDLGLYEAGSSKDVRFTREGVSYIFCNIHPEMSAVVVALQTPLYAIANAVGGFAIADVPPGDYEVHLWVEGVTQNELDALTRIVHLTGSIVDLGAERLPPIPHDPRRHANEFGQPYKSQPANPY